LTYDCIIVNGDSYSAKNDSPVWADALAKKLNLPLVNLAAAGSSNDRILRSTIDYLENSLCKYPLVIIGWSFVTRMEIWYRGNNQHLLDKAPDNKNPNVDNQLRFLSLGWIVNNHPKEVTDEYKNLISLPTDYHKVVVDFYLKIFLLTNYLKNRNINYFMFSGASNSDWHINDLKPATSYSFCREVNNDPQICKLYEFSLSNWAKENDSNCSSTFHLSAQGHIQFADHLYQLMKSIHKNDI
jgi:hypothetical protein